VLSKGKEKKGRVHVIYIFFQVCASAGRNVRRIIRFIPFSLFLWTYPCLSLSINTCYPVFFLLRPQGSFYLDLPAAVPSAGTGTGIDQMSRAARTTTTLTHARIQEEKETINKKEKERRRLPVTRREATTIVNDDDGSSRRADSWQPTNQNLKPRLTVNLPWTSTDSQIPSNPTHVLRFL